MLPLSKFDSFEYMNFSISVSTTTIHLVIIYRPPPSTKNRLTPEIFFIEFATFLEEILITSGNLVILGDFNFHVDNPNNPLARKFLNMLESFNLSQLVTASTHQSGHTLDLVITRSGDTLVSSIDIFNPAISDHEAIFVNLTVKKPEPVNKCIRYRCLKKINFGKFCDDLGKSPICTAKMSNVNDLSLLYNRELESILDDHAPLKTKTIVEHIGCEWYTDELGDQKHRKRKLERRHKTTGLTVDLEIYKEACAVYEDLRIKSKREYYSNQVLGNIGERQSPFAIIHKLLHKTLAAPIPSHDYPTILAQDFCNFFDEKILKINQQLDLMGANNIVPDNTIELTSESLLESFSPITVADTIKLIKDYPIKSCTLDPIPAQVFKEVYITMAPSLTNIVNLSMTTAQMPSNMKEAMINPILKKPQLDKDVLNNYRPVSNLPFVSKLIERAVVKQLVNHQETNNLSEKFQSAYRKFHSTETALTCVLNDLLMALDQKQSAFLVLLDLSAAFDTVDYAILLRQLETRIGLRDLALDWVASYLSCRYQHVSVAGKKSSSIELK